MQFGIRIPVSGPFTTRENIEAVAQQAESLGFDSLIAHDHVSWDESDKYHFSIGSAEAVDQAHDRGDPITHFYEMMVSLSYVAGLTDTIRLIPTAAVLPWRNPVILAKQAASLYHLSSGRFELGVCIGNVKKDFAALDTPFRERGAIMDEYLEVLTDVLSNGEVESFEGEYISLEQGSFWPTAPNLPIWYGGESEAAMRRTAQYADGWLPLGAPETIDERLPILDSYLEAEGRTRDDVDIGVLSKLGIAPTDEEAEDKASNTLEQRLGLAELERHPELAESYVIGSPTSIAETLVAYKDIGVDHFFFSLLTQSESMLYEDMELIGDEVIDAV